MVRKALEFFGIVEAGAAPRSAAPRAAAPRAESYRPAPAAKPVVRLNNGYRGRDNNFATIHTVRPRRYQDDAEGIAFTFRDGSPVIVDLGQMVDNEVRRMIDFLSGLVKGLDGTISRVSGKVYMLTPAGIEQYDDTQSHDALVNGDLGADLFD
ncbi:MAG: cell division protein SepF [Microbacteriaceae bacterium]